MHCVLKFWVTQNEVSTGRKSSQSCLYGALQGSFCPQTSLAPAASMKHMERLSSISWERCHLWPLTDKLSMSQDLLRLGNNNLLSPKFSLFPRKERTLAWEKSCWSSPTTWIQASCHHLVLAGGWPTSSVHELCSFIP